jgi:hypothetical protein
MTIFALGCIGWRAEQDRLRAARRHDIVNLVCAFGILASAAVGLLTGGSP